MTLMLSRVRCPKAAKVASLASRILSVEGSSATVEVCGAIVRDSRGEDRWTSQTNGTYADWLALGDATEAVVRAMGILGVEWTEPKRGPSYYEMGVMVPPEPPKVEESIIGRQLDFASALMGQGAFEL